MKDVLTNNNIVDPIHDWALIDDSNPKFNVWESRFGYRECFRKGKNPNHANIQQEEDFQNA